MIPKHAAHSKTHSNGTSPWLAMISIERAYIKVGVAAVDLGDRRAMVTSVDVQATILE